MLTNNLICSKCNKEFNTNEYINESLKTPIHLVCDNCGYCFYAKAIIVSVKWDIISEAAYQNLLPVQHVKKE